MRDDASCVAPGLRRRRGDLRKSERCAQARRYSALANTSARAMTGERHSIDHSRFAPAWLQRSSTTSPLESACRLLPDKFVQFAWRHAPYYQCLCRSISKLS